MWSNSECHCGSTEYLKSGPALAGVAQWTEHRPAKRRVTSWFPVRAHAWVVGQVASRGRARGNRMFLSLPFSLPSIFSVLKRREGGRKEVRKGGKERKEGGRKERRVVYLHESLGGQADSWLDLQVQVQVPVKEKKQGWPGKGWGIQRLSEASPF